MSPISLIEFNDNANIDSDSYISLDGYNPKYNQSGRPIVGTPFITMDLGNTEMKNNGYNTSRKSTSIKLKFLKAADSALNDNLLYKTNAHN
jgi:hypothetical protein